MIPYKIDVMHKVVMNIMESWILNDVQDGYR